MKYAILKADGSTVEGECASRNGLGLEASQKIVGGFIEIVSVLHNAKPCTMVVNEEGALCKWGTGQLPLPINARASDIYKAWSRTQGRVWVGAPYIHGDVILYEGRLA